ncbi:hypothetical protein GCM10011414_29490 [Croceivirga lutea]|uniref:DUF3291 domain-containing protein n=1 Tax=Croceivirga lutea TaxID=1775167 RepID=UPI00163B07AA|nr:DUF3291 domain-containing protein [Croceivirga lutea]GGG57796.1 hypothetical protein GCM10011414_29490 [Croceivirga lutea]
MTQQITTISIFTFSTIWQKIWAFFMMQFAHGPMRNQKGLEFYKLLGTGKTGFNPLPDWGTYAVLQVWNNEQAAKLFFEESSLFQRYVNNTNEHLVLFMKNMVSKGEWNGNNPFKKHYNVDKSNEYLAVITRATIKTRLLLKFWKFVPKSQHSLSDNKGLLYTKGVGEMPFKQMATFSIWKNKSALEDFAYRANGHITAIKKTRDLKWYSEELFARFQPYHRFGNFKNDAIPLNFN